MTGQPLVDAHQVAGRGTGNETWARNVVRVLEADGGAALHYAVTIAGAAELGLTSDRVHLVGKGSVQRLMVDLPRHLRRLESSAVVAQYTLPLTTRVPGVVVVHDVSFVTPEARAWIPPRSLLRYRVTIGTSVRVARRVLVPTEHTRDMLLRHYRVPEEKVLLAPLALDSDLSARLDRPRTPREFRTVLCVGTLLPRKNLPVVARAVARLRSSDGDVRLRLVGPVLKAGAADLALMKQLLGGALEVVGAVSDQALAVEYSSADVLAYPSVHEGFGLPLLEGMAAGLPVVASTATCLPEVAGDAALLVDPHDDLAWAAALREALARPEGLVVRGRARVSQFSWERTGVAVRQAIEEAIG